MGIFVGMHYIYISNVVYLEYYCQISVLSKYCDDLGLRIVMNVIAAINFKSTEMLARLFFQLTRMTRKHGVTVNTGLHTSLKPL